MGKALKLWSLLAGALILMAGAAGLYAVSGGVSASTQLRPDDEALTRLGGEIYVQSCASCHGADLKAEEDWRKGNPDGTLKAPPHDETGHTWHHADELLFRITKFGTAEAVGLKDFTSNMPAFQDSLTDQQIIAVLSWIKAQWPDEIKDRHDLMNERARNQSQ
ncbi:c-type cytochrome [Roseibium sp.]|uniref:c-type cytochrome n=1 Tax=Roseibium sp. TaxID=1936156 RepID=UPI003A9721DA